LLIGRWHWNLEHLKNIVGLHAQPLSKNDAVGLALAEASGVHGVYVHNALAEGLHDGLLFSLDGTPCGLAWFGPRGNLVVITDERLAGRERSVAELIKSCGWPWRIVLGESAIVDVLGENLPHTPLAQRNQVYYVGVAADAPAKLVREDMRLPLPLDRERLARATLALNASDLNIAPSRVDRRWLYKMIDERVEGGSTRVLGPTGGLWCKLDYGSDGPGGPVIEGVFTFPDRRGRGLGAELVATCISQAKLPVCLHVAEDNRAARSAYERAGMREVSTCRLLLQG
jgi:GNAT superfamily N-acetyltransferase